MVSGEGSDHNPCYGRFAVSQRGMRRKILLLVATGAYSGYAPIMPGTAGSVVGVALYCGLAQLGPVVLALLLALLFAIGVWVSGQAERHFGEKDARRIVIDEVLGVGVALYLLPITLGFVLSGFLVFRALDIWKPFGRVERMGGGLGVMLDDLIAGALANVALQVVRVLWGVWSCG